MSCSSVRGLPALRGKGVRDGTIQAEHMVDAVSLFLFSAATALPHRIHYDREYARSEGHADLPVHGPLQGAWMIEAVAEWAREWGGSIANIRYRNIAPAYAGDRLTVSGAVASVEGRVAHIELEVSSAAGDTVSKGTADVVLAHTGEAAR